MGFEWLSAAALATAVLTQEPALPAVQRRIPFELRDNLVTFDVVIAGRRQNAVLDSGAGALIVGHGLAKRIGLTEELPVGSVAGAGEQAQQLRPVNIPELLVGPLRFNDVPGYSVNLEQLSASAGFPVDLLIGAPAFQSGEVTVDYNQRQVTFGPSGSAGQCAAPIPLTLVHEVPVVEVELRATANASPARLKLVVDLGTRHRAVIVGGAFVRSEAGSALVRAGQPEQIGHGTGGQVQGAVSKVASLQLGTLHLEHPELALASGIAAFESGEIDGSLGVPLWKDGVITFDYPAKQLCIDTGPMRKESDAGKR